MFLKILHFAAMGKYIVFLLLFFICQHPVYASSTIAVDELSVLAYPDPVFVHGGRVTFLINVSDDFGVDYINTACLFVVVNSTTTDKIYATSSVVYSSHNIVEFNFSYDPSLAQTYTYYFKAYDKTVPTPYSYTSGNFTFDSYMYPRVTAFYTDGPVKYDGMPVAIWATIDTWSNPPDTVVLNIRLPVSAAVYNSSPVQVDADTYNVSFVYDPVQLATYAFDIFVNDTAGYNYLSDMFQFESEGYPPEINDVTQFAERLDMWENLTFEANVTDPKDDVTSVVLEIYLPFGKIYVLEMNETLNDIYAVNWTLNDSGYYFYRVCANDTENYSVCSSYSTFYDVLYAQSGAAIRVELSPVCSLSYDGTQIPDAVIMDKKVVFLVKIENKGTVALKVVNQTVYILKDEILNEYEEAQIIEEGTHIVKKIVNENPPEINVSDSSIFYADWLVSGYFAGGYNATIETYYISNYEVDGFNYTCEGVAGMTHDFIIHPEPEIIPPSHSGSSVSDSPTEIRQEPIEIVQIVLVPLEASYEVFPGQLIPTYFNVTNLGTAEVTDVTLAISSQQLSDWIITGALVSSLAPMQTVKRTVFFRPPEDAIHSKYLVPVTANLEGNVVDLAYVWIDVLFGEYISVLKIIGSPDVLEVEQNSNVAIPLVIKNQGMKDLHNITVGIENAEICVSEYYSEENYLLEGNKTESFELYIRTEKGPQRCEANLIMGSAENAHAFAPITIIVKPAPALFAGGLKVPLIAFVWTLFLVSYVIIRKRQKKKSMIMGENIGKPNPVVYLLLFGEFVFIIYFVLAFLNLVPFV